MTLRAIGCGLLTKAAEDSRTPGRWRMAESARDAARFWSAAVLCRFGLREEATSPPTMTLLAIRCCGVEVCNPVRGGLFIEPSAPGLFFLFFSPALSDV